MTAEDRIDPLGQYRGIRSLREGSVFAKYKIKKKFKRKKNLMKKALLQRKRLQNTE